MSLPPENEDITPEPEFSEPDIVVPMGQSQKVFKLVVPKFTPYATYCLIGLTVLIFLLQGWSMAAEGQAWPVEFGVKDNALINAGQYWRLITPVLLHVDVMHLAFSMYALFALGREMEFRFGHLRFALIYLLGAFTGITAAYLFSTDLAVGASGGTFALLLAFAEFTFRDQKVLGYTTAAILRITVQVALINIFLGLAVPGIGNWVHIGGALSGAMLSFFGGPQLALVEKGDELHYVDQRPKHHFYIAAAVQVVVLLTAAILLDGPV